MKISKKLWLSVTFTLLAVTFFNLAPRALALSSSDLSTPPASYAFKNESEITAQYANQPITFLDKDTGDSNYNFKPETGDYCTPKGVDYKKDFGIKFSSDPTKGGATAKATIILGVSSAQGTNCQELTASSIKVTNAGPKSKSTSIYQWNASNIDSTDGKVTYTPYTASSSNVLYGIDTSPDACGGESDQSYYSFIVLGAPTSNKGTIYALTTHAKNGASDGHEATKEFPALKGIISSGTCYGVLDTLSGKTLQPMAITISGRNGTASAPVGTLTTGDNGPNSLDSSSDCESNSGGFSMAWAVCPVLDAASGLANEFIGLFEDQLSFRVSDLGSASDAASGYNQTKTGWAVIRDVASSLIVIFMLIMVLSQAISWGPFDAYTVKKLLPKMVVAIIVMQISWNLFVWVVGLFDDLGHGIANLMYLPFGGPSNMDLWHLLGNAHVSAWTLAGINYGVLVAGLLAVKMAVLPAFMGIIFSALLALAFGLFTLIFRKILIIMLLMLAPLALVAWILPGTAQYWKMWRENFIKALSMFPIAMAIIAAGRIFAKVAGAQDGNGTFLNMIFVFVGFFGPLFILPKTFKWGGQAMQMAGNGVIKAREQANVLPKKYFKRKQDQWNQENKRNSQERVGGKKEYGRYSQLITRPLDKFGSGQWDPLLGRKSRRRFESLAQYQAAGRKSSGETFEAAMASAQQLFDTAQDHDQVARDLMRGGEFEYIDKRGKRRTYKPPAGGEAYMRAAGATGIVKYGTDKGYQTFEAELDRMRAEGGEGSLMAEEILDHNVERLKAKNDAIYRGFRRDKYLEHLKTHPGDEQGAVRAARRPSILSSVDSMKDVWFDGMEGATAQSYLGSLSHGIAEGDSRSSSMMTKLWQTYQEAIGNPQIHISPGVHKAFKAYADGTGLGEINESRMREVNDVIKGDLQNEDGSVTRVEDTRKVRDHAVLDTITNDDESNEDKIRELHAREITSQFDSNGSPVREAPKAPPLPAPDEPPDSDRSYRPRQQSSNLMEMSEGGSVRMHSPVSRATEPREFAETEYGAQSQTSTAVVAAPPVGVASSSAPAQEVGAVSPSAVQAPRTVERLTREVRSAPTIQSGSGNYTPIIAPQPEVNVNVNSEAIGQAVASSMRNVLQHTTLKIDHPDAAPGTGRFEGGGSAEESSDWDSLRPPSNPSGPSTGPAK